MSETTTTINWEAVARDLAETVVYLDDRSEFETADDQKGAR